MIEGDSRETWWPIAHAPKDKTWVIARHEDYPHEVYGVYWSEDEDDRYGWTDHGGFSHKTGDLTHYRLMEPVGAVK